MIKDDLWQPERCNCLIWALVMRWLAGGELGFRPTKGWSGKFHIVWYAPDGRVMSYVPWDSSRVGIVRSMVDGWFKGHVKTHYFPGLWSG